MIPPEAYFYVTGGTLPKDAPSYVERQADSDLFTNLHQGEFCYVLTSRQMGKSSLMGRTAVRLRNANCSVAILDLTAIGQNLTIEQWYFGLLARIGRNLGIEAELEDFWLNHKALSPLQCWSTALEEVVLLSKPGPIVIFIDEIDAVRSLPFSTSEFFASIRELYNRRAEYPVLKRLTFCFLGVARPSDLIQDSRMTPFNIGRRIDLGDFSLTEALALAQGLRCDNAREIMIRILYWTGGHPYLTQRLCRALAEEEKEPTLAATDRCCMRLFLAAQARERDDNLLFVRENLLRSQTDPAALLLAYSDVRKGKQVPYHAEDTQRELLRLSGLCKVWEGRLLVRNRIYQHVFDGRWIQAHLPNAELRRQRAAFRKGALRVSALSSVIIGIMSVLIFREQRAILLERQSRLEEQGLLFDTDMNLAQRELEQHNVARVLDLLNRHQSESDKSYAWRYLYRQCNLAKLNCDAQDGVQYAVAFSADSRQIATGAGNGMVTIWNTQNGAQVRRIEAGSHAIFSLAYSSDGHRLATGNGAREVKIWNVDNGRCLRKLSCGPQPIIGFAFSVDGSRLTIGCRNGKVCVWQVSTGRLLLTFQGQASIHSLAYTPDNRELAMGGEDGGVRFWNAETGKRTGLVRGSSSAILLLAFSADGKWLATGDSDATINLWDRRTGYLSHTLHSATQTIRSVTFSPDGRWLATGSDDNSVLLWDAASGQLIRSLDGHTHGVTTVAFSHDGRSIAASAWDGTTRVWDLSVGNETIVCGRDIAEGTSFGYSPNGEQLAEAGPDNRVTIRNTATGDSINTWSYTVARRGGVTICNHYVAMATTEGDVNAYDPITGRNLGCLKRLPKDYYFVGISPDQQWLAAASFDHDMQIWNLLKPGRPLRFWSNRMAVSAIAFSPDGQRIATGDEDDKVRVWDLRTQRLIWTLPGHARTVLGVAFSPDNATLASTSEDGVMKLWELTFGHDLLTFTTGYKSLRAVTFSRDGDRIRAVNKEGIQHTWISAPPETGPNPLQ